MSNPFQSLHYGSQEKSNGSEGSSPFLVPPDKLEFCPGHCHESTEPFHSPNVHSHKEIGTVSHQDLTGIILPREVTLSPGGHPRLSWFSSHAFTKWLEQFSQTVNGSEVCQTQSGSSNNTPVRAFGGTCHLYYPVMSQDPGTGKRKAQGSPTGPCLHRPRSFYQVWEPWFTRRSNLG